ncbi:hypothetical protein JEZ13_03100 [bacterium]|nr:hypothetical protein [bacterium]
MIRGALILYLLILATFGMAINQYPLDTAYHSWETLSDSLLHYHQADRLISDIEIIGNSSAENLPIYAIHIHKSKEINNKKKKIWEHPRPSDLKKVLIIGQHHGEEPIGVEIAMSLTKELTSNSEMQEVVSNYYFVIIPTVNPEAFKIVNSGIYPLKRKNNRDTNQNGELDIKSDGVDLNKNYPSNWEIADLNEAESPYYKGTAPASETEIQAVIALADRFSFDYAFLYHSSANGTYPEMVFFPYNWGSEKSKDWDQMRVMAEWLVSELPCLYKENSYHVYLGETRKYGYARDYLYRNYNTLSFTIETSAVTPSGVSHFLPNNRDLKLIVEKHTSALINLLRNIKPK